MVEIRFIQLLRIGVSVPYKSFGYPVYDPYERDCQHNIQSNIEEEQMFLEIRFSIPNEWNQQSDDSDKAYGHKHL